MAYRLLLPSSDIIYPRQVEEALSQFDVYRTHDVTPTWSVCDLAVEASDAQAHRLTIRLLRDDAVAQEEDEPHFMRPEGSSVWLELRTPGAADDRSARLALRLCAITVATHLSLPVLETRNGVFCQTPDAFAAWCSRSPHPDTVLLGESEHVTLPKKPRVAGRPLPAAPQDNPDLSGKWGKWEAPARNTTIRHAPLPKVGVFGRAWRKWLNLRTYVVSIPPGANPRIVYALTEEITSTFGDRNVMHDEANSRLLIVAKNTSGTAEIVGYYRRRAHPERLRLAASIQ